MCIGDTIKKLRKNRGWTQGELAEKLGVTQKVICDYERKIRKPPIERLPTIAAVFGISIEELLGTQEFKPMDTNTHPHGNKRVIKLQQMFEQLDPIDQRAVVKHVSGLLAQKNSNL